MNKRILQAIIVILVFITYTLLFYLVLNDKFKLDFSTFYSSLLALKHGDNPYATLVADYLPVPRALSNNLCPPIFLVLAYPLAQLSYHAALLCWCLFSFIAGLIGAAIAFNVAYSKASLRKYGLSLMLFYLMLFSTIMNLAIGQIGSILFFFIMLGYHYYLRQRDYLAGTLWAIIISIKFFPGLLFFYVLSERRFKTFFTMFFVCCCCWVIPLFLYGPQIYQHYFTLMSNVTWYADSWNAGIYGFLFRLFTYSYYVPHDVRIKISLVYLFVFIIALGIYWKLLQAAARENNNHYRFCLTLIFMLLLSPFGWIYYFFLLILPLALYWSKESQKTNASTFALGLWLLSFFLLNFPLDYVKIGYMPNLLSRVILYSFHFYGLLLLAYLLSKENELPGENELVVTPLGSSFIVILILGLTIPLASFIMTLIFY